MNKQTPAYNDFHDAGVAHFRLENGIFEITLEVFNDEKQGYDLVSLIFRDVKDSKIGLKPAATITALYDDGDVLDFSISDNAVKILIEWIDFHHKTKSVGSYSFTFENVDISDERTTRH